MDENQTNEQKKDILVPFLILLAFIGVTWYLVQRGENGEVDDTNLSEMYIDSAEIRFDDITETISGKLDSLGNWVSDPGVQRTIVLPDGTNMVTGVKSTEYKLFQFITDVNFSIDTIDKTQNWVSFDRVFFETGKSVLTAESMAQIKSIALILKNFPQASIKIGGYTDNTGSTEVNNRVSEERAVIVTQQLIQSGAGEGQIKEAVGYGPEHPVATNDTEEGRAQNRRVDLKLASK